jgi:hypothetical protein
VLNLCVEKRLSFCVFFMRRNIENTLCGFIVFVNLTL